MKNKILFIQEFGEAVPSGIIRGTIFREELDKRNIEYKIINRNSEKLIRLLNDPKHIYYTVFLKALNRVYKYFISIYIIILSVTFQSIWLNKVLSSRFIYFLRLVNKNKIINLDVVDNPYEVSQDWVNSLKFVSSISTDNLYNQKNLKKYFSKVFVIPDYPIIHKFNNTILVKKPTNFNFGWVGSKSSYYLLKDIEEEIIHFLNSNQEATFYLLGCPIESKLININRVISYPIYDEKIMIDVIKNLHVGLFPLDSSLASEVRGVLKATLYMAGNAVVLANPIGEINDLIKNDFNGILINQKNEWTDKLIKLSSNRDELYRLSQNAYTKLIDNYTIESNCNKILQILEFNELD